MSLDDILTRAIEFKADRVILIERWNRGLGKIRLFVARSNGLIYLPPLMLISRINLRNEISSKKRTIYSSIVTIEREDIDDLVRIADKLSHFFNLPLLNLDEAMKKPYNSIYLKYNSLMKVQITFKSLKQMVEIGPRITFSKIIWEV